MFKDHFVIKFCGDAGFVLMFTVPLLYEKNEELVDLYGEIALAELKKQYVVIDEKVMSQIPLLGGSSKKD